MANMELVFFSPSQRGFEYMFRRHGESCGSLHDSLLSIGDSILCMPQTGPRTFSTGAVKGLSQDVIVLEFSSELRVRPIWVCCDAHCMSSAGTQS